MPISDTQQPTQPLRTEMTQQSTTLITEDAIEIGVNQPDIMNISRIAKSSGFHRDTIRAAIDAGEMPAFKYARQVCVRRPDYVRWVNSLGEEAANGQR